MLGGGEGTKTRTTAVIFCWHIWDGWSREVVINTTVKVVVVQHEIRPIEVSLW